MRRGAWVCVLLLASLAGMRSARGDWTSFELSSVHPFVGMTLAAGPAIMKGGSIDMLRSGSVCALRAGAFVGRSELAVEVSPLSYFPTPGMGPTFQAGASYAYLLPVHESRNVTVYWPLRSGIGLFAYNSLGQVFAQLRADVAGIALRVGHVIVEAHAPSLRYAFSFASSESLNLVTLHFGGSLTYAF